MISAIILAAGQSKRMGQAKQLLGIGGKALLQQVLDAVLDSDVDEVLLVLGHEAERIRNAMDVRGARVVVNRDYAQGMITSIREGLKALDKRSEAFFIVLGDQPEIRPAVYNRLIREFRRIRPSPGILLPAYQGEKGHPALFSIKYLAESFKITGDVGFREIIQRHPEEVFLVDVGTAAILADIDTPEDFREYLQKKSGEKKTLTLGRALELGAREIISLAGGGGKTTLMFALGRELATDRKGVLLTTTTKIWDPEPSREFSLFLSKDLKGLKRWVGENLGRDGYLVVARERLSTGKLAGLPPSWVDELLSITDLSYVVVEADGAAGRPLKAPREGEPVLPQATTLLIPVVGIDALGCPLNEEHVFRARIAMKILEAEEGAVIDEGMIARLLAATLGNRPAGAKAIPFINKVDLPEGLEKGKRLARVLLESIPGTFKRVLLGQAQRLPAVQEISIR